MRGNLVRVIDNAAKFFGGDAAHSSVIVKNLYRKIRALRIYEGAADTHRVLIAPQAMTQFGGVT